MVRSAGRTGRHTPTLPPEASESGNGDGGQSTLRHARPSTTSRTPRAGLPTRPSPPTAALRQGRTAGKYLHGDRRRQGPRSGRERRQRLPHLDDVGRQHLAGARAEVARVVRRPRRDEEAVAGVQGQRLAAPRSASRRSRRGCSRPPPPGGCASPDSTPSGISREHLDDLPPGIEERAALHLGAGEPRGQPVGRGPRRSSAADTAGRRRRAAAAPSAARRERVPCACRITSATTCGRG